MFSFESDTFAFANELLWTYRFDPVTGEATTVRNIPPPQYAHRCFVMVRSARQFFLHARFQPGKPPPGAEAGRRLIRQVVGRSPSQPSEEGEKIAIPGYDSLRSFSRAQEALLKAECGGAWQSYTLRTHWRMVFPIWRRHQARLAGLLLDRFAQGVVPIVHILRFPQVTINHGLLLFKPRQSEAEIRFAAYDPNQPAGPTDLIYRRQARTFELPRNHYWAGGRVDVIEVYRGPATTATTARCR